MHVRSSDEATRREKRVVICVSGAFCMMDQEKRETARSLTPTWAN